MIKPEEKREIIELWKQGVNKSEIARRLDISRPTVRKYIREYEKTMEAGFKLERLHDNDYKYSLLIDTLVAFETTCNAYKRELATGASPFRLQEILGDVFREKAIKEIKDKILERGIRWQHGEKYILYYNDEILK